ncbi:Polygalacturonate 4-alpha-galacturonosyltransferase [Zea mays]|uniref:Polygalacturonate 4-alpha-galacturonosyltransferase n=1 Tax=Zea mays TaxID=4577 RepID=A0A3L6FQ12_MAIZE|nr:Polygalacturonate 4-alpha-galacturonosyltransferase [Zea mays]
MDARRPLRDEMEARMGVEFLRNGLLEDLNMAKFEEKHLSDLGYLCGTMEALNVPLADTPKLRGRIGLRNKMEVVQQDDEALVKLENTGIERSKAVDSAVLGKYSIWRRENENYKADSRVRLMRDQMIMARIYFVLAKSRDKLDLYQELLARLNESQRSLGEATTDVELPKSASDRIKAMGQVLSKARDLLYDCKEITQRLRAMLQSADEQRKKFPNSENLENPDLYHYALFSDNVLSASVVVNSTIMNAKIYHVNLREAAWFSALPWVMMAVLGYVAGIVSDMLIRNGTDITLTRKIMQSIGFLGPGIALLCLNAAKSPIIASAWLTVAVGLKSFGHSGFLVNLQIPFSSYETPQTASTPTRPPHRHTLTVLAFVS